MRPQDFDRLLKYCRGIFCGIVPNLESRGTDFDSQVYKEGLFEDINIIEHSLRRGDNILEIGCGKGHISVILASLGFEVTAIDMPETTGEFQVVNTANWQLPIWKQFSHEYGIQYQTGDCRSLPYKNNSFDAIVAYAVFEHVSDDKGRLDKALDEAHRVLKKNGKLFICRLPRRFSYAEWLARKLKMPCHNKLFKDNEIKVIVNNHGFNILCFRHTDMIIGFLPFGMKFWNAISPLLFSIEFILLKSPLSSFAHHSRIICRKDS